MAEKKHSPLGASGAERWMNCPGSVELIRNLKLPESDAPDYRLNGTAAHELAAQCLTHERDTWEYVGQKIENVEVDVEMADAVQVYLDVVRPLMKRADEAQKRIMIEYPISSPIHPDFYGTVDLAIVLPGTKHFEHEILDVTDYKHGEGILVEVEENPQIMYYAYGILQDYPEIEDVTLRIVQPRGFHPNGPVREWQTTAAHIREFVETVLVPAMDRTAYDSNLDPGSWCRFCPAKLVCPTLTALFGAAAKANPKHIVNLSDEAMGRNYNYIQGVKFYIKALEDETYRRLNMGATIPGTKLVHKRGNRVFRDGADTIFRQQFGDAAFTKPDLKGPAEMEKINPAAKELVKSWAYTPETGLTVAGKDDLRTEVVVHTMAQTYAHAVEAEPAPAVITKPEDDDLDIPAFLKRERTK